MKPIQCVIGAAGHIDHGKTSLVKALTGVDCDRFEEEKRRGITIDIGFARLDLPEGRAAGIVDVPGHQRFIHNMLAGAAGIDLAMMVIAADDSVMPQTVEHLAILEMLGVTRGVVALTKTDLVDEETLEIATLEVTELIEKSCLKGSKIIPCSAITGDGVEELRKELIEKATAQVTRWPDAFFRMPVDRVFSIKGHGLVLTGTVFSGAVKQEDKLVISPGGAEVRVRRVHSHDETVDSAPAGTRAAINVSGGEKDKVARGSVICHPSIARAYTQFTAEVICHSTSPHKIAHGRAYLLHIHTAETLCRVYLASDKNLNPGESCPAQIRFEEPIQALIGDRFVLRSSSARHTLGGGVILEPGGKVMGRRRLNSFSEKWSALKDKDSGVLAMISTKPGGVKLEDLTGLFNMPKSELMKLLKDLKDKVITYNWKGADYACAASESSKLIAAITDAVKIFHEANPALAGIEETSLAMEALPGMDGTLQAYWIRRAASSKKVEYHGSAISLPGRKAEFAGADEEVRDKLLTAYKNCGYKNPPKSDRVHNEIGVKKGDAHRMIRILNQTGDLINLAPDYTLHKDALEEAKSIIIDEIKSAGSVETARARDLLGVGRKAAIDILEYMDKTGATKRVENTRVLA